MEKFVLRDKKEKPPFEFMVVVSGEFDYFVYNDFDDAVKKAKELGAKSAARVNIFEMEFVNPAREWRVRPTFYVQRGRLFYDKCANIGLHVLFHTEAGEWKNKKEYENNLTKS